MPDEILDGNFPMSINRVSLNDQKSVRIYDLFIVENQFLLVVRRLELSTYWRYDPVAFVAYTKLDTCEIWPTLLASAMNFEV